MLASEHILIDSTLSAAVQSGEILLSFVLNFIISNSIELQFRAGRHKFQHSSKPCSLAAHWQMLLPWETNF